MPPPYTFAGYLFPSYGRRSVQTDGQPCENSIYLRGGGGVVFKAFILDSGLEWRLQERKLDKARCKVAKDEVDQSESALAGGGM